MLMSLLSKAAAVATLSFVVSSMLAMGAGLTVARIIEPLRNVRLVLLCLLANFVLMPLTAVALATLLGLDEPSGVGLLLLGCAAGAPFLPKLAELAKGNIAFAVGTMVLLMVVTVGRPNEEYEAGGATLRQADLEAIRRAMEDVGVTFVDANRAVASRRTGDVLCPSFA